MAATMEVLVNLVVNFTRLNTLRSAVWRCPKLYITVRVFKNVAKVTNLEAVEIQLSCSLVVAIDIANAHLELWSSSHSLCCLLSCV